MAWTSTATRVSACAASVITIGVPSMDYEFSANCDLRNIAPFWKKIGDLIDGGISEEELAHIERFAYSVKDNSHDVIQMSFSF